MARVKNVPSPLLSRQIKYHLRIATGLEHGITQCDKCEVRFYSGSQNTTNLLCDYFSSCVANINPTILLDACFQWRRPLRCSPISSTYCWNYRSSPMMLSILAVFSIYLCIAQFYSSEYGMQLIDLIKCLSVTTILPMNSISYFVLHWLAPATFWNTIWWYGLHWMYHTLGHYTKLSIVHIDFVCFLSTALATLCGIQLIGPNNGFGTSLNGSCTFSWMSLDLCHQTCWHRTAWPIL